MRYLAALLLLAAGSARGACSPLGNDYAFIYSGTQLAQAPNPDAGTVRQLSETGVFEVSKAGTITGHGTVVLRFEDGAYLVVEETLSGGDITDNGDGSGSMVFVSSLSPLPRSVTWACADDVLFFQSTSPGTVATGRAVEQ